jgi:hypothetical protein
MRRTFDELALLLFAKTLLEVIWRHVDIAENLAEGADSQSAIAMHGHHGINVITCQYMVTAANSKYGKSLAFEETQYLLAADARKPSHG